VLKASQVVDKLTLALLRPFLFLTHFNNWPRTQLTLLFMQNVSKTLGLQVILKPTSAVLLYQQLTLVKKEVSRLLMVLL
jgi:hypothetical protein